MRNTLPASLPSPAPSDMSEVPQNDRPQIGFAEAIRHHDGGRRRTKLSRINREYREAPRSNGAAGGLRMTLMSAENIWKTFFVHQHLHGFSQPVKKIRGRRIREEALRFISSISSQRQ